MSKRIEVSIRNKQVLSKGMLNTYLKVTKKIDVLKTWILYI